MSKDDVFSFEDDIQGVTSDDSELAKVTELLLNDSFPRRKTILPDRIIAAITTLDTIAYNWDITFLKSWIPNYCQYLTSKDGQGRKDIVGIAQASLDRANERDDRLFDLMGKR
jgi:hypothetical protein